MNAGSVWDAAFSSDPQQRFLYVADGENAKIHILQRDTLEILTSFGEGGRQVGQWHGVHNIATDSQGNIYTTETYDGKRIQKFTFKGLEPVTSAVSGHALAGVREVGSPRFMARPSVDGSVALVRWRSWPAPCRRATLAPTLHRRSVTRWPRGPTNSPATCSRSPRTSTAISGSARRTVPFDSTAHASSRGRRAAGSAGGPGPAAAIAASSQGGVWVGFGSGGGVARIHRGGITLLFPRRRRAGRGQRAPRGSSRHGVGGDASRTVPLRRQPLVARDRGRRLRRRAGVQRLRGSRRPRVGRAPPAASIATTARGCTSSTAPPPTSTASSKTTPATCGSRTARRSSGSSARRAPLRLDPRIRLPLPGWRIIPDGRGGLLVASFSGGLFRLANPTGAHPLLEPVEYEHRLRGSPRALYRDRDDNIWVGHARRPAAPVREHVPAHGPARRPQSRRRAHRGGRRRRQHLDRHHAGAEPSRRRPAGSRSPSRRRAPCTPIARGRCGWRPTRSSAATRWAVSSGSGYRTSRPAG